MNCYFGKIYTSGCIQLPFLGEFYQFDPLESSFRVHQFRLPFCSILLSVYSSSSASLPAFHAHPCFGIVLGMTHFLIYKVFLKVLSISHPHQNHPGMFAYKCHFFSPQLSPIEWESLVLSSKNLNFLSQSSIARLGHVQV